MVKNENLTFFQKLQKLQEYMGGFAWEKDGINRYQSYKYITENSTRRISKKPSKTLDWYGKYNNLNISISPKYQIKCTW